MVELKYCLIKKNNIKQLLRFDESKHYKFITIKPIKQVELLEYYTLVINVLKKAPQYYISSKYSSMWHNILHFYIIICDFESFVDEFVLALKQFLKGFADIKK